MFKRNIWKQLFSWFGSHNLLSLFEDIPLLLSLEYAIKIIVITLLIINVLFLEVFILEFYVYNFQTLRWHFQESQGGVHNFWALPSTLCLKYELLFMRVWFIGLWIYRKRGGIWLFFYFNLLFMSSIALFLNLVSNLAMLKRKIHFKF